MKDTIFQTLGILRHTRAYFSSPEATTPRNLTQEMLQTMAGNEIVAPRQFALESQDQPNYNALGLRIQDQSQQGYTDDQGVFHPGVLQMGRNAARFQRTGDITDVETLGPRSYEAMLAANPLLRRSLSELTGRLPDSGILRRLNTQAESELDAGGALTPAAARTADQEARAAFADRGMLHTDQSAGAELLNREVFRNVVCNRKCRE